MSGKISVEFGPLQRSLFMPLWARARETKKEIPLLVDCKAVEIIDSVDYDFSTLNKNLEEIDLVTWISHCRKYDEIINRFIIANPYGTIVNIGCGMDTYYERAINNSVHWYDLDLPEVIDLRRKFFSETSTRKFITESFLKTDWFNQIELKGEVLFISAGVFCYFEEMEIKNFLVKIADRFPSSELLFDVTSLIGIKLANYKIAKTGMDQNLFMKWALKNKKIILSWDSRFKLIGVHFTFKQNNLNISFINRVIVAISDFLNIQYILHLKVS